jgi:hypothetical protein
MKALFISAVIIATIFLMAFKVDEFATKEMANQFIDSFMGKGNNLSARNKHGELCVVKESFMDYEDNKWGYFFTLVQNSVGSGLVERFYYESKDDVIRAFKERSLEEREDVKRYLSDLIIIGDHMKNGGLEKWEKIEKDNYVEKHWNIKRTIDKEMEEKIDVKYNSLTSEELIKIKMKNPEYVKLEELAEDYMALAIKQRMQIISEYSEYLFSNKGFNFAQFDYKKPSRFYGVNGLNEEDLRNTYNYKKLAQIFPGYEMGFYFRRYKQGGEKLFDTYLDITKDFYKSIKDL